MTGFNHCIPWPPSWFTIHSAKRQTPYLIFMLNWRAWRHQDVAHVPHVTKVILEIFSLKCQKKHDFWLKYSVFLLTSGFTAMSLLVTSYLIHCEGIWEHFGGIYLRSRFYSTPCFFGIYCHPCEGTGAQFEVHARTNELCQLDCEGSGVHTGNSFLARWLVEMGHVNKGDDVSNSNETRDPPKQYPLSFPQSDWLLPPLNHVHYFHQYLLRMQKIVEIGWIFHSEKRESKT